MYCKYCGKEIPVNSKFCRYCGNEIKMSTNDTKTPKVGSIKMVDKRKKIYGGFIIRLGAYFADLLGLLLIAFMLGTVLYMFLDERVVDSLLDSIPDVIYGYFAYVIYNTITLTIWSTTFGKYLYGLRVSNEDNSNLNFGESLTRSLLQPFSTIFFGIGYWKLNKNTKRQAWHDKTAKTVVTKVEKNLIPAYIVTAIASIVWYYFSYMLE